MVETLYGVFRATASIGLYGLVLVVIGVLLGLLVGVLPGLTFVMGVLLLVPFTYSMDTGSALTLMLAAELRSDGILVNSVCPGWVATDMGGPGGRPVGEGAASVLWAVDLPDGGATGTFTRDGRPVPF